MRRSGQQENEKCSRARAVKPVVCADGKGDSTTQNRRFRKGKRRLFSNQRLAFEHIYRRDRQNKQHYDLENIRIEHQRKLRTAGRSDKRKYDAENSLLPRNKAVTSVADGRERRAHGGAKLVCGNCVVRRKTGYEVGREGDKAAASGNRINVSGEKNKRADY